MSTPENKSSKKVFNLRLDEDLKNAIEKAAKENDRSLHAEIIYRLKRTIHRPSSLLSLRGE